MTGQVSLDLGHLAPEARAHALEDDEARLRRVRADRWIPFDRGLAALEILEELLAYPERTCMPNLLLHGASGMGKTMLSEKFRRDHPQHFDAATGVTVTPIVFVEMPSAPSEARFYGELLANIQAPVESRATLARKEALAMRILPQLRPRMLMIDEVNNLLAGNHRQQRQALNLIKYLGNKLRVPIVGLGTDDALRAIRTDPQMESRFWTFELPRWREDEAFRTLLASIALTLPLRRASPLGEQNVLRLVLAHTSGVTRDVFRLMTRAAEAAIRTGVERIDADLIKTAANGERRAA